MQTGAMRIWFAQSYERVLSLAVMLLLVGCSIVLMMRANHLDASSRNGFPPLRPPSVSDRPFDAVGFRTILIRLTMTPSWQTNAHRLFIAPVMIAPDPEKGPERLEIEKIYAELFEGIPIRWLVDHQLKLVPGIANMDSDGDEFTNIEEYLSKTNPTDAGSRPDPAIRLRVMDVIPTPVPFLFEGIGESVRGQIFSMRRLDGRKSYFVKVGEPIPDPEFPGWKIVKFTEKFEDQSDPTIKGYVRKVDVSELVIQKEGKRPVTLIKGKPAFTDDWIATLIFLPENRRIQVAEGDFFELQSQRYQVGAIRRGKDGKGDVLVKKSDSGARFSLLDIGR
ncbi:MAG: hypothetical protein HY360_16610 [Verrucomicrobia bacterium]|nr:hypothetical protein [Verrucomicrobiota bacterium]